MYTCFEQRVALVTGGASGIGEAIVRQLSELGASVVIVDRNIGRADDLAAELISKGAQALAVEADVTNPDDNEAMVTRAIEAFGALHYAVNNAGINGTYALTGERSIEDWRHTMATNLDSVFYGMRYELPAIVAAGGGAILNVSSVYSRIGFPTNAPYAAAKAGVLGLTRSTALEYIRQDVRINALCPGPVWTPLTESFMAEMSVAVQNTPIGRGAEPEEMANIAVFALSDKASFMVGTDILADGGISQA